MSSPLIAIITEILTAASRHQLMLQAAANDHDLAFLLDEIARDHIAIVEQIVAAKKVRERRGSWAPADHDDFDNLMVAAEMAMPSAAEKSFLLTMEDIYQRCGAGLPDILGGSVSFTPEAENHLLDRWFPDGVPVRRGVPDAGEIGLRLMRMSGSRAKGSDGRIQESEKMQDLVQHLDAKYGRRLAH